MKKVAVILSGCGFKDGSEITEAISALICLSREGVHYQCFAPNIDSTSTNHLNGSSGENRNLLVESARIARGQILDVTLLESSHFDALLFPGGYGAAKNLCNWADKGAKCDVLKSIQDIIVAFYNSQKPIAAICIAPALIARVLGSHGISVTLGDDSHLATEIEKTGAIHEMCPVEEYISDRDHKILSTPAYMYEAQPHQVYSGISKMIREFVEMS